MSHTTHSSKSPQQTGSFRKRAFWSTTLRLSIATLLVVLITSFAQGQSDDDAAAKRDARIIDRFWRVLERNPRKGLALDRTHAMMVQSGSFDERIKALEAKANESKDAKQYLLLALLHGRHGNDELAIQAFAASEKLDPQNPLTPYYLAQSQSLAGQWREAADSYRRAVERKPSRNDLLEIYQQLARLYQRMQKVDEAMKIWDELEQQFPRDERILEEVAFALKEEERYAESINRFEKLIKVTRDRNRRASFEMEIADSRLQIGERKRAIEDYEKILDRVRPGSWMFKQLRDRIEDAYLSDLDSSGLADYYTRWLEKNPNDIDAIRRLAICHRREDRIEAAKKAFDQAIELAPRDVSLRLDLISLLTQQSETQNAIAEYEQLDKISPNHPDYVRQWGSLWLNANQLSIEDRRERAAEVWMKLVQAKPEDPVTLSQVADLLHQAKMTQRAIDLYRKAIVLAPEDSQYREYLGDYLHTLDKKEEALATWKEIAEGPRRNAQSLTRLMEIYKRFGYAKEAIASAKQACMLAKDDLPLHLKYVDLLSEDGSHSEALTELKKLHLLAEDDDEEETIIKREIECYVAMDTIAKEVVNRKNIAQKTQEGKDWKVLALFQRAISDNESALQSIERAIELDEKSTQSWRIAAELYENNGDLTNAVKARERLARLDIPFRSRHLQLLANLYMRLARYEDANKTAQELITSAPGNAEFYQFSADIFFRQGRLDDGLNILRRAVRTNPSDEAQLLALAEAHSRHFKTQEAIELYWQAFDRAKKLQARLVVISKLSDLHLQISEVDRLIQRLEGLRRQADDPRELSICIARVYSDMQDLPAARDELANLLNAYPKDIYLLRELSAMAENEQDLEAAVSYQRKIVELSNEGQERQRLADLLSYSGEHEEAQKLWQQMILEQKDPVEMLKSVDQMLRFDEPETAAAISTQQLQSDPTNWEWLYRHGLALTMQKKHVEAAKIFAKILQLTQDDSQTSQLASKANKSPFSRFFGRTSPDPAAVYGRGTLPTRVKTSTRVKEVVGFSVRSFRFNSFWAPDDFGQARMVSIAWLIKLAEQYSDNEALTELASKYQAFPDRLLDPNVKKISKRELTDGLYAALIQDRSDVYYEIANRLSVGDNSHEVNWLFLYAISFRNISNLSLGRGPVPLTEEQVDRVQAAVKTVAQHDASWLDLTVVDAIQNEFQRVSRERSTEMFNFLANNVENPQAVQSLFRRAVGRDEFEHVIRLTKKLAGMKQRGRTHASAMAQVYASLVSLIQTRGQLKKPNDIITILDAYLHYKPVNMRTRNTRLSSLVRNATLRISSSLNRINSGFPRQVAKFDNNSLNMLRMALGLLQSQQQPQLLVNYLLEQQKKEPTEAKWETALAFVDWTMSNRQGAVQHIKRAIQLDNRDADLRFDLAHMQATMGDVPAAIATLESIQSSNQAARVRKQVTLMQWCRATNDIPRAQKAAERLYGLQLPPTDLVYLGQLMQQLNMQELSQVVMSRAKRRGRSNYDVMTSLMNQYFAANQKDLAIQVAYQILRRPIPISTKATPATNARKAAIAMLKNSGKLNELLARTEGQLKRSPNSVQIRRSLAELYRAAGNNDKARQLYVELAKRQPRDAKTLYQIGNLLVQSGNSTLALEQYEKALRINPGLYVQNYRDLHKRYSTASSLGRIAQAISESGQVTPSNASRIVYLIRTLARKNTAEEAVINLSQEVWDAAPAYRSQVISAIASTKASNHPKYYNFMYQEVLSPKLKARFGPWLGLQSSYLSRFLKAAETSKQLQELHDDLVKKTDRDPKWIGGRMILSFVERRMGQEEKAAKRLESLLAKDNTVIPSQYLIYINSEIQTHPSLTEVAIVAYERSVNQVLRNPEMTYTSSIAPYLIQLYRARKDTTRAVQVLRLFSERTPTLSQYDPLTQAYMRVDEKIRIATELRNLKQVVPAFRILRDLSQDQQLLLTANRRSSNMSGRVQAELTRVKKMIGPTDLIANLEEVAMIKSGNNVRFDLMVTAPTYDVRSASISSLIVTSMNRLQGDTARAEALKQLMPLYKKYPSEVSMPVLSVVIASRMTEPQHLEDALKNLKSWIDQHGKLGEMTPQEARSALNVWFAALHSVNHNKHRVTANQLAEYALHCAKKAGVRNERIAILRAIGQYSVQYKDMKMAETYWSRLMEVVARRPRSSKAIQAGQKPPQPLPLTDFVQLYYLSEMAIKQGLKELSLACFAEALAGGPPVIAPPINSIAATQRLNRTTGLVMTRSGQVQGSYPVINGFQTTGRVRPVSSNAWNPKTTYDRLEGVWLSRGVTKEQLFELLAEIILPPHDPDKVHRYSSGSVTTTGVPSLASRLVEIAQETERIDTLRKRLDSRTNVAQQLVGYWILQGQLAIANESQKQLEEPLKQLSSIVEKNNTSANWIAVCEVLIPAIKSSEMQPIVMPLANKAAQNLNSRVLHALAVNAQMNSYREIRRSAPAVEAMTMLDDTYRHILNLGNRFSANDSNIVNAITELGIEYAIAGRLEKALSALEYLDTKVTNKTSKETKLRQLLTVLYPQLRALPNSERYQLLVGWMVPQKQIRVLRWINSFVPNYVAPAEFYSTLPKDGSRPKNWVPVDGVASLPELLIQSAKEAGKLQELLPLAKKLHDDRVAYGQTLHSLARIAASDNVAMQTELERIATALKGELNSKGKKTSVRWQHYLLARAALASPQLRKSGEQLVSSLLGLARATNGKLFLTHLRFDLHASRLTKAPQNPFGSPLKHWVASDSGFAATYSSGYLPSWWTERQGTVGHLLGSYEDRLYLRYPLTGKFEIHGYSYNGPFNQSAVGFGGVGLEPFGPLQHQVSVLGNQSFLRKQTVRAVADGLNQTTLRVDGGNIEYLVNGRVIHRESGLPNSAPWYVLLAHEDRETVWSGIRITGNPTIPKEVVLSQSNKLLGWSTRFYMERAASHLATRVPSVRPGAPRYDWDCNQGIITGYRVPTYRQFTQSWLQYNRPLNEGEEIEFEFFYKPGEIEVAPTIGRVAMLIEPKGVALHWVTSMRNASDLGLTPDNRIEIAAEQKSQQLKLKLEDWNTAKIKIQGGKALLHVNGDLVYERVIAQRGALQFGLYHDQFRTMSRVRNVRLRGNWPTDAKSWTRELLEQDSASEQQRSQAVLSEKYIYSTSDVFLSSLAGLSAEDKYARLQEWVFPSDMKPLMRTYCSFAPREATSSKIELKAPLVELFTTARELNKLDALKTQIDGLPTDDVHDKKRKIVAQLLLAIQRGDSKVALQQLELLQPLLKTQAVTTAGHRRFPELIAFAVTAQNRETAAKSFEHLDHYVRHMQANLQAGRTFEDHARFMIWFRSLATEAKRTSAVGNRSKELQVPNVAGSWTAIEHPTAASRARGDFRPLWQVTKTGFQYSPGHATDYVYLDTPLTGDFVVEYEIPQFATYRPAVMYGGHCPLLHASGGKIQVRFVDWFVREIAVSPPIKRNGDWIKCRLVVQQNQAYWYFNGQRAYMIPLGEERDPWLAIQKTDLRSGQLRNLRLIGNPSVASEINISKLPGELGWCRQFYGPIRRSKTWSKRRDELVSLRNGNEGPAWVYYHRPMLENGEFDCEVYFNGTGSIAFPSLGTTAYKITADGVYEHEITNAEHERRDLGVKNLKLIKARQKSTPKIKDSDWNAIKLKVTGSTMQIHLNGEAVYEREIELPKPQRRFGFFHFRDESTAKVRNVIYRGEWNKAIDFETRSTKSETNQK